MEKQTSFEINHEKLYPGLYVSQKQKSKDVTITIFDLRFCRPNIEPAIDLAPLHTIEHLGIQWFKNCLIKEQIIYFGPLGSRTGFCLITFGDVDSNYIFPYVKSMLNYIVEYNGVIPKATSKECGNYLEHNLPMAKYYVKKYIYELNNYKRFLYEK